MKILYIFPGARPISGGVTGELNAPDTQQYGYNHLTMPGVQVDAVWRDDAWPRWFTKSWFGRHLDYRLRFAPLIFTARDYDIVFGPPLLYLMPLALLLGGKAKYVVLNIELVRILRGSSEHSLRQRFLTTLLKKFSLIVCLAESQRAWLLEHYSFLEGKVFFVPLGADIAFYKPILEGRSNTVLSVGKDNGRDYSTLIDSAKLLPDMQFEIICSARNLAGIEQIPANVTILYDLPIAEVRKKYQTAGMIILATHDDTSILGADCSGQTVLLDAMASGIPIIATYKEYLSEYVRNGEDALIVPSANPRALADAITSMAQNLTMRSALARHARMRAETEFSSTAMAARLQELFIRSIPVSNHSSED